MSIFRRELSGNVNFQLCKTIKKAIDSIFNDTKNIKNEKIVILLSPCSASYDQFNNFEERGSYRSRGMDWRCRRKNLREINA